MAGYANIIGRQEVGDALVPDQVVNEILQEAPKESVILQRARNVRMSAKKSKQPVLASLPDAYWVDGDTGLKQTTTQMWDQVTMTAEELAVIVPIPNSVVDDSNVPLWDEVRPRLAEAIGKKVDRATLFSDDKPASWPEGIVPAAIAAGNTLAAGTGTDLGQDVAKLGQLLSEKGHAMNGFATAPGFQWQLVGMRSGTGAPIYTPAGLAPGAPAGLYGYPLHEVINGAWQSDKATLLGADWTKFAVGIRQDITFDLFSEGVISDADGKVILNLMQQDSKALRVVFRVGFQIANPLSSQTGTRDNYPAAVLTPAAAGGSAAGKSGK